MGLASNNVQRLRCHYTNQPTNHIDSTLLRRCAVIRRVILFPDRLGLVSISLTCLSAPSLIIPRAPVITGTVVVSKT